MSPITLLLALSSLLLAGASASGNVLYSGGRLLAGESLVYKEYTLIMQGDCNLAVYRKGTRYPIWSSNTSFKSVNCYASLSDTGLLTIANPSGLVVWTSVASSSAGTYALVLRYDGSLYVYGPTWWKANTTTAGSKATRPELTKWKADSVMWTNDVAPIGTTIANGAHELVLEESCNLVLYNGGAKAWETNTTDKFRSCYVNLEGTGEFMLKYMGGDVLWRTGKTTGRYGEEFVLILSSDGKLAVYGPSIWSATPAAKVSGGEEGNIAMVTQG